MLLNSGSESKIPDVQLMSDPFNVLEPNQDEVACFCKGKFYQTCPPKQSGCIIRKRRRPLRTPLSPDPYELHDSKHPDHVDIFEPDKSSSLRPVKVDSVKGVTFRPWKSMINPVRSATAGYNRQAFLSNEAGSGLNLGDIGTRDTKPVVRYRKVYVAEKTEDSEPVIHPIELTIPVKIKKNKMCLCQIQSQFSKCANILPTKLNQRLKWCQSPRL